MTDPITRLFLARGGDPADHLARAGYGKRAGIVGIGCNVLLCACKIIVGVISGSVAIIADGINNLSDASSSIISLIGFRMAVKPADDEHPYGHGRYEYLSALTVALLIVVIGIELLQSGIEKIADPTPVDFGWVACFVLVFSILVKFWMMAFNRSVGHAIDSATLIATAFDSRNDVIATSAVLIGSIVTQLTGVILDGWMTLAVAIFIIYSGFGLVKDTLDPLLGSAPDPSLVDHIHQKILSYPHVLGTHDLMIHDYGPGRMFASVHVEMAAEDDVLESHDVLDNIEQDFLNEEGLHMVVHFDPIVTSDSRVGDTRSWIAEQVRTIDERLTIHDLRMVPGPTHTNVIFDCVRPHDLALSDAELKERIAELVSAQYPTYNCVINIDDSYVEVAREAPAS